MEDDLANLDCWVLPDRPIADLRCQDGHQDGCQNAAPNRPMVRWEQPWVSYQTTDPSAIETGNRWRELRLRCHQRPSGDHPDRLNPSDPHQNAHSTQSAPDRPDPTAQRSRIPRHAQGRSGTAAHLRGPCLTSAIDRDSWLPLAPRSTLPGDPSPSLLRKFPQPAARSCRHRQPPRPSKERAAQFPSPPPTPPPVHGHR